MPLHSPLLTMWDVGTEMVKGLQRMMATERARVSGRVHIITGGGIEQHSGKTVVDEVKYAWRITPSSLQLDR